MTIKPDEKLSVELPAKIWQGLAMIVARAVSPLDVENTAVVVGEWQMGLARAEQAAINAKAQVDPPE